MLGTWWGARAPQDALHSCKCFLCQRNSYTPVPSSGVHVSLNRPNGICFLVKQHWLLIRHPTEAPGQSTLPVLWEALVKSLPFLFPHLKIREANGDRLTWLSGKSGQQLPEPGETIRDAAAEVVPPAVLRTLVGNFGLSGCSNIGSGLREPQPTHISPHTFRL